MRVWVCSGGPLKRGAQDRMGRDKRSFEGLWFEYPAETLRSLAFLVGTGE